MKAKGNIVTRAGLAEVFGVALPTVDGWVRQGCPVLKRGGRGVQWEFDVAAVTTWRIDKAVADATSGAPTDIEDAKRRKIAAEASLAELELAKAKGEVAPIRDFERTWSAMMAAIQQNVMNVPQRVVVQLLGETNETAFKQKLRAELTLALEQAATAEPDMTDDDADDDAAGT